MFCSNCGKKVNDGAKFCWNCGSEIITHEQAAVSESENQTPVPSPAPAKEKKQEETQPAKKEALNKKPCLPYKKNKKLFLLIGGAVLAVVLLAILIAVISANKVVGEIPDPMYYFADFDVIVEEYTYSDSAWLRIGADEEGASIAAQGYVALLKSGDYPFTCVNEDSTSGGSIYYDFCYNGKETYSNPSSKQLSIILNGSGGNTYLVFYDYPHFDFVSREQYSGEVYLPSLESYLEVNWSMKEEYGHLYYDFGNTSDDAAKELINGYAVALCQKFGFTLMEDLVEKGRWLLYGETQDTFVDIAWYGGGVQFAVSENIVLVSESASASSEGSGKANTVGEETENAPPAPTSSLKVTEGVDLSYLFEKKENGVQDVRYWSEGSLQFDDDPLDMDSYTIYYLDCGKSDLNTYIDMLCQNGFTLVADYDRRGSGISGGQFIEYALVSNDVEGISTRSGIYTKAENHIDIWWEDYHNCWRMEVVKGLEVCDLGIRRDGTVVPTYTRGESAECGLLHQDGYYTTEDGRLRSGENEATIVVDGEVMTGELYNLEKKSRNEYRFYMDGFGKGEMEFSWDKRSMEEGSIFLNTLADEDISLTLVLPNGSTKLSSESYKGFSKLLLRVMHYDAEGDAVFYLYGESFSGHSVEVLMAVNLWEMDNPTTPEPIDATGAETIDVSADTTIRIKVGETVTLHCVYSEFGSMYHTYDWSSSGSTINMSESYNKVTVKGIEPGTAEIYMTYHYTKDEPDVLTGNTRHNGHSRSRTYTIIVE